MKHSYDFNLALIVVIFQGGIDRMNLPSLLYMFPKGSPPSFVFSRLMKDSSLPKKDVFTIEFFP